MSFVSNGTNYYIDSVVGVDTNNGTTTGTPWKNISKVNALTLAAGDKIYLKCGSVWNGQQLKFGGSGSAAFPIIVDKYGTGAKPILNGNGFSVANQGVVYLYNQDNIEINNLEITNYPILLLYANSTAYTLNQIVYNGTNAYQVTTAGTTSASGGTPIHTTGAVVSGTVTFTYYCKLTNLPYPDNMFFTGVTDHSSETNPRSNNPLGADRRGVMVAIKDKGVSNHIYLKNLDVHHVKGQLGNGQLSINGAIPKRTCGIYFTVLNEASVSNSRFNDILIDGCAINYVENTGLAFDNEDDVYYPGGGDLALWTARRFTNIKVSNNVIHHIGKNAMIIRCTDETGLIEYNTCYETAVGTTGNTMFSARAKGTVFQYNEGYFNRSTTQTVDPGDIDGSMYDPDYGSVGVIFQYSYSHDNSEGIYWGCNTRGSNNNTTGIPDPEDVGCTLRYCISQNDMGDLIFFNYPSAGNEIYNNVFYIKSGLSSKIIHESSSKNHAYNFFNNIIFDEGDARYAWGSGAGVQTRNFKNNVFYGIPVPTEISSSDNQILTTNPLFVNPGTGNSGTGSLSINSLDGYKLKIGSPALAVGKLVSTNGGKDYFGNSVSFTVSPNRGAFEGAGIFPYFYSKNASDLSNILSWGLNATDGSGTPPENFTEDNQGFILRDVSSTLNANWTLSGANSILKIGYDTAAAKLEISNNKTFSLGTGSSMIISPFSSISCANGSALNFNSKPVTLLSNAFGTATVGQINGSLSNATNVTVERYIPAKRAWRALTSPVNTTNSISANWQEGGTGNGVNGLDIWSNSGGTGIITGGVGSSLLSYISNNNTWSGITDTTPSSSLLSNSKNKPFMAFVTGPYGSNNVTAGATATTIKATGTLFTGNQTYTSAATEYTFIGNPYASPLSLTTMLADTDNAGFAGNIWIWDANVAGTNAVGSFNLFTSGTYTNLISNILVTSGTQIQSGQAFFVKSTAGGTFTIKEAHKGTTFSNAIFRDAAPAQLLRVGLYKQSNTEWSGRDGAMTVILPDADANQTTNKMANGSENVAFTKNAGLFASNHHLPLVASDILNVKVWNTTAGANYKLKINTEEFTATNLNATLEDLFTNARTPLTLDGTAVEYPFSVTTDALSTGNRFRIVFQTSALGINNPTANGFSILPNPVTGDSFQVNLGSLATGNYSYTICNTMGQEVEKGTINNAAQNTNYTVKMSNTATGIYIMKVTGTDDSVFTAKIIKK